MSKKHHKQENQPEPQPPLQEIPVPPQPQPQQASSPATKAQIWTFWGAVAAAVVAARVLDAALPNVPERVTERWIMVAFAAFLGVFLYRLNK